MVNMDRKNFLFLFFILLLIVAGLAIAGKGLVSKSDGPGTTQLSPIRDVPAGAPGDSYGLAAFQTYNAQVPLYHTQNICDGRFSGYIEMVNNYNESHQYLLLALLDYRLVSIDFADGRSDRHLLNLGPKTAAVYPFNVSGISAGYHDVNFMMIKDPGEYYVNLTFGSEPNASTYTVWDRYPSICNARFNVIEECDDKPVVAFGAMITNNSTNGMGDLYITTAPLSDRLLVYANMTANSVINYYVNVANNSCRNGSFVVVQMLDGSPVPMSGNNASNAFYGRLAAGESGSIPVALQVPDVVGTHELLVMLFPDPYENVDLAPGVLNPDMAYAVEAIRVGINVTSGAL